MKNFGRRTTVLSLVPVLLMFTAEAGAQNRERPSFADIDANDDGKLSLEEFSKMGSRRGTPEEMFERLDTNGDGYITEDEFESRQRGGRRGA
ncbi:MAG: EF-hand domain-containing protein [Proteobacteria bacterium]|nr:EF-hand domain-containing protein [Pseudomonadota bacterium]